jgi:hypothetical protein
MIIKDNTFRSHQIRQLVWLEAINPKTTHLTHKLQAKRYGPFKISNVISHMAYQLQLPPSWKIYNVFHVSYLSPYKETEEHRINFPKPPPKIIESKPEWKVEAIIGQHYFGQKKQVQYQVHWKGYLQAEDT